MGINRLAYTHFPQSCVFVDLHKYTQYIVADWKKYIYLVFTVDSVHLLCYNRDTPLPGRAWFDRRLAFGYTPAE